MFLSYKIFNTKIVYSFLFYYTLGLLVNLKYIQIKDLLNKKAKNQTKHLCQANFILLLVCQNSEEHQEVQSKYVLKYIGRIYFVFKYI